MKITINKFQISVTWFGIFWWLIIGIFLLITTRNLQYNTAFVDEAIYATVGEEFLRGSTWEHAISWMGGSYIYPIISAQLNRIGGLEAVRLFAIFCVLITGIIVYKIGTRFDNKYIGLLSMGIFLFTSISLNLSLLGTYDTPSLALLAISFYLFWNATESQGIKHSANLITSAVLFSVAILIKYVAVFWAPVFGLIWLTRRPIKLFSGIIWGLVILSMLIPYIHIYRYDLYDYFTGTHSIEIAERAKILKEIYQTLYLQLAGAILGIIALFQKENRKTWLILVILLIGGLLPILYHLGASNFRSIWKHMVYGSVFLSPVAAWSIMKSTLYVQRVRMKVSWLTNISQLTYALVFILIVSGFWRSFDEHWRFQRSWPSYSKTISYLDKNLQEGDKVFAEASAVLKYHLFRGFQDPDAWASTWYMEYEGQVGTDAMKAALNDKKYKYVILSGYFTPWVNDQIKAELLANYELALIEPYKVSGVYDMTTEVWVVQSENGATNSFISQTD